VWGRRRVRSNALKSSESGGAMVVITARTTPRRPPWSAGSSPRSGDAAAPAQRSLGGRGSTPCRPNRSSALPLPRQGPSSPIPRDAVDRAVESISEGGRARNPRRGSFDAFASPASSVCILSSPSSRLPIPGGVPTESCAIVASTRRDGVALQDLPGHCRWVLRLLRARYPLCDGRLQGAG
jgi:hypothetical protein